MGLVNANKLSPMSSRIDRVVKDGRARPWLCPWAPVEKVPALAIVKEKGASFTLAFGNTRDPGCAPRGTAVRRCMKGLGVQIASQNHDVCLIQETDVAVVAPVERQHALPGLTAVVC